MASQELIEKVGKYIDRYYKPDKKESRGNQARLSVFDKITGFRIRHGVEKRQEILREASVDYKLDRSAPDKSASGSMKEIWAVKAMPQAMMANQNIEELISQMEETLSQRLLRMIDERGMTDSEAYTKA